MSMKINQFIGIKIPKQKAIDIGMNPKKEISQWNGLDFALIDNDNVCIGIEIPKQPDFFKIQQLFISTTNLLAKNIPYEWDYTDIQLYIW